MKKLLTGMVLLLGAAISTNAFGMAPKVQKLLFYNYTQAPLEGIIFFVNANNPNAEISSFQQSFPIKTDGLTLKHLETTPPAGTSAYIMVYKNIGSSPALERHMEENGLRNLKDVTSLIVKNSDQIAAIPLAAANKNGFIYAKAIMTGSGLHLENPDKLTTFEFDLLKREKGVI
jgi:hypothetical protein